MTIKTTRILGMNIQYTEGDNISDAVLHSNDGPILERIFRSIPITSIHYGNDRMNSWVQAATPSAAPRLSFSSEAYDPRRASLNPEDEKRLMPLISELITPRYTAGWFADVVWFDDTRKLYGGGTPPSAKTKRARSVLGADDARPEDFSEVCPSITAAALREARQATRDRKVLLGAMLTHLAALNTRGASTFSIPAEMGLDVVDGTGGDASIRKRVNVLKAAWSDFRDELTRRGFTVDVEGDTISW